MAELDAGGSGGGDTTTDDTTDDEVETVETSSGGSLTSADETFDGGGGSTTDEGGTGGGELTSGTGEVATEPSSDTTTDDGGGTATGGDSLDGGLTEGSGGETLSPAEAAELADGFDEDMTAASDAPMTVREDPFAALTDAQRERVDEESAELARDVLAEYQFLDRDDVRIVRSLEGERVTFSAELTESGRRKFRNRQFWRNQTIVEGGLVGETGDGEDMGTPGGATDVDQIGENLELRRQATLDVERNIERQVGAARAAALGLNDPSNPIRQQIIANTDLERGEDFTVTRDGNVIRAELTDEYRQEFAEEVVERQIERETGVDFEPDTDFTVTVADDGTVTTEFTEAGQLKAQTAEVDRAVAGVERALGVDVPGEGRAVSPVDDDLGDVAFVFPDAVPVVGGERLETVGENVITAINQVTEVGEPGSFAKQYVSDAEAENFEQALASGEVDFTQSEQNRQSLASGAIASIARTPAFPVAGALFLKDVAEFGQELEQTAASGDVEATVDLAGAGGQATVNALALGAGGVLRNPYETAGAVVGSLVGTAGLFGAARAVGPRTSLATRGLIQPGEEALGYGGFAATRALRGRATAERYFPNKEPLIFSEEAAIRAARRVVRGADVRDVFEFRPSPRQARIMSRVEPETSGVGPDPTLPGDRPVGLTAEAVDQRSGAAVADGGSRVYREEATGVQIGMTRELEFEEGETSFDDVRDDALTQYQDYLGDVRRRESAANRDVYSDFEGESEPFATRAETREQVETLSVDAETELERAGAAEAVVSAELARAGVAADVRLADAVGELNLGREIGETVTEFEGEAEFEGETEGFEFDVEAETEFEFEAEAEAETEFEFEAEAEAEAEAEVEVAARNLRGGPDRQALAFGGFGGRGRLDDSDLTFGFLSETFAAFAGQAGRARAAPGQPTLELIAETGAAPVYELPTAFELGAGAGAIADVRATFGLRP